MTWLLGFLAIALLLDALRMRGRVLDLAVCDRNAITSTSPRQWEGEQADAKQVRGFRCVLGPGVVLTAQCWRQAAAYAEQRELEVLDLLPGDMPATDVLAFSQIVEPNSYRTNELAPGRTAGHCILIDEGLWERARVRADEGADPVSMAALARRLKHYAPRTTDFAVAPLLRAGGENWRFRYGVMREVLGMGARAALAIQIMLFGVIAAGVAMPASRPFALLALAALHLQPLLVLLGSPLRARGLWRLVAFRLPVELWRWAQTAWSARAVARDLEEAERDRSRYTDWLGAMDMQDLFEPEVDVCPLCGAGSLCRHLQTRDLLQHKPGKFRLDRCRDCGHIFQNPRLSLRGLEFYYADFYDGVGERNMETVFAHSPRQYLDRARMVAGLVPKDPPNWLDVGAGHGHFCLVARNVLPKTEFDGLDLSESVDEAARRGWIKKALRGLFPQLARSMSGQYDVVSMHHYLEHTLDPKAELQAARQTLKKGGHLLIELPDPESFLGRLLGRYWVPWFQPQHQHLLSTKNLQTLLEEHGFEVVSWHTAEAHQRVDLLFAAYLFIDTIAPPTHYPWRPPATHLQRAWRVLAWTAGVPMLVCAYLLDSLLAPLFKSAGMSNTFRVVARRA